MKYHIVTVLIIVLSDAFGYPQGDAQDAASVQSPSYQEEDDSDMYLEPEHAESRRVSETEDREPNQQRYYPAFLPFHNPPLGHSRPFFFQQEGAYSQRPHAGYQHQQLSYDAPRFSGYKDTGGYRTAANTEARGLLGSGNFGVIRGGTFYDKEAEASSNNHERDYSPFFRNGHGRPSYHGGVPNPRPYQHEQFANFRDFADINTPSHSAYSHFVVVYANKNATREEHDLEMKKNKPKNIIESLALLDDETTTTTEIPQKKLSKSKLKLSKLLPEKKYKYKKSQKEQKATRDLHEPLLALS